MKNADYWKEKLNLQPHPEGGYFRETYRAGAEIPGNVLSDAYNGSRNTATSIYFMLEGGDFSSFHRLKSDELWYFHLGSAINIFLIDSHGHLSVKTLGADIPGGEQLQLIIPAGTIFGAEVKEASGWTLAGCMVSPGFDFEDFELLKRDSLVSSFPQHQAIISRLTRS
jgi:hypothetical protein